MNNPHSMIPSKLSVTITKYPNPKQLVPYKVLHLVRLDPDLTKELGINNYIVAEFVYDSENSYWKEYRTANRYAIYNIFAVPLDVCQFAEEEFKS